MIVIADHDPTWVSGYEAERARVLTAADGLLVELEHIGSTSVPGLAAKPIIDLLGAVADPELIAQLAARLAPLGYEWRPRAMVGIDAAYLRRAVDGVRLQHLHVVRTDQWASDARRAFRDILRAHPEIAAAYATLKRELALRYGDDRMGYTEAKTDFVEGVLARHSLGVGAGGGLPIP